MFITRLIELLPNTYIALRLMLNPYVFFFLEKRVCRYFNRAKGCEVCPVSDLTTAVSLATVIVIRCEHLLDEINTYYFSTELRAAVNRMRSAGSSCSRLHFS